MSLPDELKAFAKEAKALEARWADVRTEQGVKEGLPVIERDQEGIVALLIADQEDFERRFGEMVERYKDAPFF